MSLTAPFPWFGGKRRVAAQVWRAFGDVPNYVEPFAGSLAVLLGRPTAPRIETVNDLDTWIANFWRAVAADPDGVAAHADWPVNEADLHARHKWLVDRVEFRERMKTDPEYFDVRTAGWWVWGLCAWIGSGWCWVVDDPPNGKTPILGGGSKGVNSQAVAWQQRPFLTSEHAMQKRPHLAQRGGRGVNRKRPVLAHGNGHGIVGAGGQIPDLSGDGGAAGRGIHASALHRKLPDVAGAHGHAGRGTNASGKTQAAILDWIRALAERLRRVRVCCGGWQRVTGPAVTSCIGVTGVFLDPPYDSDKIARARRIYSNDEANLSTAVRQWAIENGSDPKLRIALCGYEGEHEMPKSWRKVAWKAQGGFAGQGDGTNQNFARERIWFSPACHSPHEHGDLFAGGLL